MIKFLIGEIIKVLHRLLHLARKTEARSRFAALIVHKKEVTKCNNYKGT